MKGGVVNEVGRSGEVGGEGLGGGGVGVITFDTENWVC